MKISRDFKAGIIVIITLLAFWYALQFMKGKSLFSSESFYFIKYNNVAGLEKSKPVTLEGLKIGRVESIEPQINNNKVEFLVKIIIEDKFNIPKNTKALINEKGLMSGKEIQLILGDSKEIIPFGGTLTGIINPSLTEMLSQEVNPIKNKLEKTLYNLDSVLLSANKILDNQNQKNINLMLYNINTTLNSFKQTSDQLNTILINNNQNINKTFKNTNELLTTSKSTLIEYKNIANKVNNLNLEQTISNLNNNLTNLNNVIEKINQSEGSLGKLVNDKELYENLNNTSKNLDELLKDFKLNPKRYVHFSVFGKK